jgi:hypothetical protein
LARFFIQDVRLLSARSADNPSAFEIKNLRFQVAVQRCRLPTTLVWVTNNLY